MIVKRTAKFSIAKLSQPDTNIKTNIKCQKHVTYICEIKIKFHIPANSTFMTKIKVNIQKLLALLLLT